MSTIPYAIEIININANVQPDFGMANTHAGINILNKISWDPMIANIGEFHIRSVTVAKYNRRSI